MRKFLHKLLTKSFLSSISLRPSKQRRRNSNNVQLLGVHELGICLDMDTSNWRSMLQAASRQRMVNRILDTLKKHVPLSGCEMVQELEKIAVRFEDKIYTSATSPVDYLQKISLKMQTLEARSDNHMQDAQGH
ncbi:hypothetical protein L2E82_48587 [Cichorium intybus]|uniref:Uncharacterized protein n=1 Tax=Cichorium intybus TaxID=13427 RepID=A0ACB8YZX9_CICIN|nr:hypothetical protein L2E82_48587 [Cichorium intybus]